MIKELVCITCPSGCHLQAVLDEQNNVLSVSGNRCPRGEAYARSELIAPRRMLTSTVRIEGALHPLLPVATSAPILKSRIFLVMEESARSRSVRRSFAGASLWKISAAAMPIWWQPKRWREPKVMKNKKS